MELSLSHWLYALITVAIILTMVFRRGVVLPSLLGTFVLAWVYKGNLVDAFTSLFNANLVAATELFHIFLIITFMMALLHSLRDIGADEKMMLPIQKMMVNGHVSFFILAGITFAFSLFFWPTPAVPLICALLVPAAVRSGLPIMAAAMVVALAGQGMALSSDYIIQVAPGLSAASAGIDDVSLVADKALILSLISGIVALGIVYLTYRKKMRSKEDHALIQEDLKNIKIEDAEPKASNANLTLWSKIFAIFVPLTLLAVVIYMVYTKLISGRMGGLEGGDGAALIGGVAVILLLLATVAFGKQHALDNISTHLTSGFIFAFKAMGPVIPIAGFFFLGSDAFSGSILGVEENPPAFLFEIVQAGQNFVPQSGLLVGFSILIIGMITGLDGSGFSGLPLTGALSASLESGAIDASTLAAIGQMGAIWTGGGTIVAWSSLIAIAGLCGVSVIELVRKNFFPVIIGLVMSTLFAVFLL